MQMILKVFPLSNDEVWKNLKCEKDAYELRQLSKQRVDQVNEEYVSQVMDIWMSAKKEPKLFQGFELGRPQWQVDSMVVTCHSLAQEVAMTLLCSLQHLTESYKTLIMACQRIYWVLLPHIKLLKQSRVFLLTEAGVRQLLCYYLILLMRNLSFKSEKLNVTGDNFCGMLQWIHDQCHLLIGVRSPFINEIRRYKHETSALLLLYGEGRDSDHVIALRMEAMNRFLYLKDTLRYEKAKSQVPSTSPMTPTTDVNKVMTIGPSDIQKLMEIQRIKQG